MITGFIDYNHFQALLETLCDRQISSDSGGISSMFYVEGAEMKLVVSFTGKFNNIKL